MRGDYICRALRLTLLLDLTWSSVHATDSFLSDTLVRTGQVRKVLEHRPMKQSACQQTVRYLSLVSSVLSDKMLLSQQVR
jgi:ERO1-like protein beta